MFGRKSVDYKRERKKAAELYNSVLAKEMLIRDALALFPKDCDDKTLIASWHALCHLEADEDIRNRDALYREEQDKYIKFIADTLKDGAELPDNIIKSYIPYHSEALIPCSNTFYGI